MTGPHKLNPCHGLLHRLAARRLERDLGSSGEHRRGRVPSGAFDLFAGDDELRRTEAEDLRISLRTKRDPFVQRPEAMREHEAAEKAFHENRKRLKAERLARERREAGGS